MSGGQRRWVLLVDDEHGALYSLADVLKAEGLPTLLAPSLSAAKQMLEIDEPRIGVVFADLVLLDGTGLELAAWVDEHRPELVVLFTSAYTDPELIRRVRDEGRPFFPKPLDLPRLIEALKPHL